jgi:hypothetical protein
LTGGEKLAIKTNSWRINDVQNDSLDKLLVVAQLHRRGLPAAIRTSID